MSRSEPPLGHDGQPLPGGQDPGWGPALGKAVRGVVPFVGKRWLRRASADAPRIVLLRSAFLAFTVPALVLVPVLWAIDLEGAGPATWAWAAQLAVTALAVGMFAWLQRQPFTAVRDGRLDLSEVDPPEQREALRQIYTTGFFASVAMATAVPLFGFVASFIDPTIWHYLAGLAVGGVLAAVIAPTRRRVVGDDRRFAAAGVPVSLAQALFERPEPDDRPE